MKINKQLKTKNATLEAENKQLRVLNLRLQGRLLDKLDGSKYIALAEFSNGNFTC